MLQYGNASMGELINLLKIHFIRNWSGILNKCVKQTERQQHGLLYEKNVIEFFKLQKTSDYTSPFDAFFVSEQCNLKIPVQIKTAKMCCPIEFGDLKRNISKVEDFILIIGFWKNNRYIIEKEAIYLINSKIFTDNCKCENYSQIIEEMKCISNNVSCDTKWGEFCEKYKNMWDRKNLLQIRFKRDHKTQKRIQCALPYKQSNAFFRKFENININYSENYTEIPTVCSDQYYTKDIIAETIVSKISELLNFDNYDLIVEPSAGSGAFIKPIMNHTNKILAYDIEPKYPNIITQDFLTTSFDKSKKIIFIGNPPFGRQSSLVKKFIKHSCDFGDIICYILPRSFKKDSMISCFPLNFHKIFEEDLPEESFIANGKSYSVPCVFQIWKKMVNERENTVKHLPNGRYNFVKQNTSEKFAFRRVGFYAGKFIFTNLENLSPQSHYFIDSVLNEETIYKLNNLKFLTNNTVGPKSVSKNQLIFELNKIL
jgi:hypothetical protein